MINTSFRNIFLAFLLVFISQLTYAQKAVTDTRSPKNSSNSLIYLQHQGIEHGDMITENSNSSVRYDEVQKILPGAAKLEKRFYPAGKNSYRIKTVHTVDHQRLVPALMESIKEQQIEIERLKSEVEALKTK
jgi:hypothetical protein